MGLLSGTSRVFVFTFIIFIQIGPCCFHAQTHKYDWVRPDQLNAGLPSTAQIYTLNMTESPFGTKLTGAYIRFDVTDANFEFVVKDTNGDALGYFPKTPQEYATSQENLVYAVINGGYFDMSQNISASFLEENDRVKNANTINTHPTQNINPTVGAIGLNKQGDFQIEYIYSFGENHQTYKYRIPNKYPGPPPPTDMGSYWDIKEGIGAGPILMKNMQIITGNIQNFNQSYIINMRHPRSAICVDVIGRLIFLVIDGRYDGSDGMNLAQLSDLLQNLNCKDAMNLDGGGSTCLYANNKIINKPSDPTGPRPVVSAIMMRDKYKKKINNLQKQIKVQ